MFSFSPPFSQNNRDNNYLNLNYEYKGKKGEICSTSKNCFFSFEVIINSRQKETCKHLFII